MTMLRRDSVCQCLEITDPSGHGLEYFNKCRYVPVSVVDTIINGILEGGIPKLFIVSASQGYGKTTAFLYLRKKLFNEGVADEEKKIHRYIVAYTKADPNLDLMMENIKSSIKLQFSQYIHERTLQSLAVEKIQGCFTDLWMWLEFLKLVDFPVVVLIDDVKPTELDKVAELIRGLASTGIVKAVAIALHAGYGKEVSQRLNEIGASSRYDVRVITNDHFVPSGGALEELNSFTEQLFKDQGDWQAIAEVFKSLFYNFGARVALKFAEAYRCKRKEDKGDLALLSNKIRDALLEAAIKDGLPAQREKEVAPHRKCDVVIQNKCVEVKVVGDPNYELKKEGYSPDLYLIVGKQAGIKNAVVVDINARKLTSALDKSLGLTPNDMASADKGRVYELAARAIVGYVKDKVYEALNVHPRRTSEVVETVKKLCIQIGLSEINRSELIRRYGTILKELSRKLGIPAPTKASDVDTLINALAQYYTGNGLGTPPLRKSDDSRVKCVATKSM
ncbi:hypothetical protein Tneu_1098 [Pyrobaculum neutrophilum V24Sta]|uniref:Uncharacterized protein n=2 Tax=Pyrobaculum neutrophilum TaxID=70771 RepID=B1YE16_PYRNV|nr:hypothetical protein Tneu_1098 [Pyrobaculum neutrophilum V24Sta]